MRDRSPRERPPRKRTVAPLEPSADAGPEPVELPVEAELDLHAFSPRDIPSVVLAYLDEAAARGYREVRLIHGKGIGWQRDRVRRLLSEHRLVETFADAPAERGHWGATLVRLRPPPCDQRSP